MRTIVPLTCVARLSLENGSVLAVPGGAALLVEQVRQGSLLVLMGHVIV